MLKDIVRKKIKSTIKKLSLPEVVFNVEKPEIEKFGDYSSNVCFLLAKELKKSPSEIAQLFIKELSKDKYFEKVEVASNGFLNFFFKKDFIEKELQKFSASKIQPDKRIKKLKINIEFISANPTGLPHIGNGRAGFFGDVLANIFEFLGAKVQREYYINDAKVSKQIKELGKTAVGEGTSYLTDYLKKKIEAVKNKIEKLKEKIKDDKEKLYSEAGFLLAREVMKDIKKFITKDLKIKFDVWRSEQELFDKSYIKKTLNFLNKKGFTYEKDGALWIKTSDFGDSQDWVLVRSTGEPSYLLSDIAYHKFIKFKFNKVIEFFGADHQAHKKRMEVIAKMFDFKGDLNILITQLVNLKEGKMSKRAGRVIYLKDLIEEVGLDSARFLYLQKSIDSQMVFDMELAKERSQKSPVYYCQYALVRCKSILRKSKKKNIKVKRLVLKNNEEILLGKEVLRFPEVLHSIAQNLQVHLLVNYTISLADKFHNFYHSCNVLNSEKELKESRLFLVKKVAETFEEIFDILGISKPSKM